MSTNDAKLLRKVLSKGNIPPALLKLDEQTRYEITTLLLEVVDEARSDTTNQIFKKLDKEQYVASDPIMGDSTLLDTDSNSKSRIPIDHVSVAKEARKK